MSENEPTKATGYIDLTPQQRRMTEHLQRVEWPTVYVDCELGQMPAREPWSDTAPRVPLKQILEIREITRRHGQTISQPDISSDQADDTE